MTRAREAAGPAPAGGSPEAAPRPEPVASVVIPARNAAAVLGVQLEALACQQGAPAIEVIVADNGSTDSTKAVAASYATRLDLRVVDASGRRGPSHARNVGAAAARSSELLFCDADDRVGPDWAAAMHDALAVHQIVTGPVVYVDRSPTLAAPPVTPAPGTRPRRYLEQVPFATSNNLAVRRELMIALGGFDCALQCCEDADLTIRAQVAGHELGWARGAIVFNARRGSLAGAARQFFRYGYYDARLYRKLRGAGLSRRSTMQIVRPYLALALRAHRLLTRRRRWSWVVNASQRAGRVVGSARFRVFCP